MTSPAARALRARLGRLRSPVARTRRLELVLPDRHRLRELVAIIDDREVARWTLHIPRPYRREDGLEFLRRSARSRRLGSNLSLWIVRRSDRALIGGIGVHHLDADHARGEVGYWLGRAYRHRGYAREATAALAGLAFRQLRLHRLEGRVFVGNAASLSVLRATGFRAEGRLRQSILKDGRFRDELVFGRLGRPARRPRARRTAQPSRGRPAGRRPGPRRRP